MSTHRQTKKSNPFEEEWNLQNPLALAAEIGFLLLFFVIFKAHFDQQQSIEVPTLESASTAVESVRKPPQATLVLAQDGSFELAGVRGAASPTAGVVAALAAQVPDSASILIASEAAAPVEMVLQVYAAVRRAGYNPRIQVRVEAPS
jgi:biopolymer transport protein ExbD